MSDLEKGLVSIRQFLERDDPDRWIWESLIEEVAKTISLTANSRDSEAVCASASALRKAFPYKNPKKWLLRLRTTDEFNNILFIIQTEFKRISEMPLNQRHCNTAAVVARADRLLGGGQGTLRGYLTELLQRPRQKYARGMAPWAMGVYGLWRSEEIELPIYIGEGNLRSRLDSHMCMWWGEPPMYVTFLSSAELDRDAMRLLVERFLIEVIQPEINKK